MKNKFALHPSIFVYTLQCPAGVTPLAQFQEAKGCSYVIPKDKAKGIPSTFPCCCIQLVATTALDAVGFTAHVAGILAAENIPCNVIAAYHHDYFLVPQSQGKKALTLLESKG